MTRPLLFLHGGTVGGWSWAPQRQAFDDRVVLAPDLPGYLSRRDDPWGDFDAVTDRLAAFLDEEAGTPVDVVGLSLGGIAALHLAARHPAHVASVFVTGASVLPYRPAMRLMNRVPLALWNRRFFWAGMARQFGLRGEEATRFVASCPPISRAKLSEQLREVYRGNVTSLEDITAPLMAIAGEREMRYFHDCLEVVRAARPESTIGLAPGMHHAWNAEDPALFNGILRAWLDEGAAHPDLLPLRPTAS
ncbi:alpha/beta fold hydrolase [Microbacterium sp. MYb62]|uniref:alpha/beta fold hydrolase n=1 Tax=Microbacterium sp. MYb62 TaxID=1848690 RepID=UPI000CFBF75B|nr:alpha/beta hydrolase [Microbacterium sp. MYb62]PRB16493.1 alpha/beta hydrolase [Microbacterium sp. MYb62]